jgi:FkbM family methyltransferase
MKAVALAAKWVLGLLFAAALTSVAVYNASVVSDVDCQLRSVAFSGQIPTVVTLQQPASPAVAAKSLFSSIAPLYFPIEPTTGMIRLPKAVTTLAIDIGARESDYLKALEQTVDETVAILLFDPLPISFLPLQQRALTYTLKNAARQGLEPNRQDRVFALHAAVGEAEGTALFNIAAGPSCGSLLTTTAGGAEAQACARSTDQKTVMVFTLEDILGMIPDDGSIQSIHIKIDAEGADLSVLKGAGAAIRRASSVIIECQDLDPTDPRVLRNGSCLYKEAAEYMCKEQEFCNAKFDISGPRNQMGNVFFTSNAENIHVPPYYQVGSIQFAEFYKKLAVKQQGGQ